MPIALAGSEAVPPRQMAGGPPRLRVRRIAIDTYHEAVAYLPRRCTALRPEDFQALAKIEIRDGHRRIMAVVNIVEQEELLRPDEIGLSQHAFALLGASEGSLVELQQAAMPGSLDAVRAKLRGEELSAEAIAAIIRDIAEYRYSKMEIAAFLVASASFLSTREVLDLTRAMAEVGNRLEWPEQNVVDKHCIGGIPGNRTSMIVVPIVAAHGLLIPKTSSRAITSPAGTADTMEVLARVDLDIEEMREVVAAERGCLVWGGHVNLSPADDVLISVERPLAIDTREQMVASILSKKLAAGSRRLVIDLPVGPTAKVRSQEEAIRLRKLFEHVGDRIGLSIDVLVSDGSQPVGRGIGPVLEARDVMQVLEQRPEAPADLRERALVIAGRLLEFDPKLRGGKGLERARTLLDSGAALRKMQSIIARQGRAPENQTPGPLVTEVKAASDGVVAAIDCFRLARLARIAGAPMDKGAGVDLFRKVGDAVEQGQPLYRIHACLESNFALASAYAVAGDGIRLEPR